MDGFHIKVFQHTSIGGLASIEPDRWEAFRVGAGPLEVTPKRRGRIDLLLLSVRNDVCELIDAISLRVDDNGYLCRLDVALRPLPASATVRDARQQFVGRYLDHANHWRPSETVVRRALELASVKPLGRITTRG
jgi:hypothetical protein